jgi:hypothetical protein
MAWCSVEAQGHHYLLPFYLYILINIPIYAWVFRVVTFFQIAKLEILKLGVI